MTRPVRPVDNNGLKPTVKLPLTVSVLPVPTVIVLERALLARAWKEPNVALPLVRSKEASIGDPIEGARYSVPVVLN